MQTVNHFYKYLFFHILVLLFSITANAQRGKDGAKNVSGTIKINEYSALTADAFIGDTILTVQSSILNSNNRFSSTLSGGDLLMVIQMQGATLGGTFIVGLNNTLFGIPKDSTWGRIVSYNNCGNYQIVQVKAVLSSSQIQLDCGLLHNFDVAGKVQVVRIPRYTTFTIPASTTVTCEGWNGTKGGILAFEVDDLFTLNGTVLADTLGFRGGFRENLSEFGLNETACDTASVGAQKGEGIGGFGASYNYIGGRFCKGAPGNAGGGGDCHNAGGGGGANGGDTALYCSIGVPDISQANYITAYNKETPPIANLVSSGGGRGGYSASTNNISPLINGPGASGWGGDYRIKNGGFGGRPLAYNTGKLFMGGGGGAGDMNDNYGGSGGSAGGLIYAICYGDIQGNGTIKSNGENGQSTTATSTPFSGNRGQDGAGGGGAGGTIIVDCYGTSSAISCQANGGNGGIQTLYAGAFNNKNQAQGPGGGGGGGYVRVTNASITSNVNGGANGTTNSTAMTNFPCNGATKGASGESTLNTTLSFITVVDDTICPNDSTTLTATYVNGNSSLLQWYDAAFGGNLLATGSTFATPNLNTNTDYYVTVCPISYRKKVSVLMQNQISNNVTAGIDQQLCNQTTAQLHGTYSIAGSTGVWTTITSGITITNATDSNATISNLSAGATSFVWTVTNGCVVNTDTVTITNDLPNAIPVAGNDQNICGTSTTLSATAQSNAMWLPLNGTPTITNSNLANTQVSNLSAGNNSFVWMLNTTNACPAASDTVVIHVDLQPSQANAGSDFTACSSTITLTGVAPSIGILSWSNFGNTANIQSNANATTVVNNVAIGSSSFILTITNGVCTASTDTVTIQVNQLVNANAGVDKTVCSDTSSVQAIITGGSGVWSSLGSAQLTSNNPSTAVNNLQVGNNQFVWSITIAGCQTSTDTVSIFRNDFPSNANAGADQTVCTTTANLTGVAPLVGSALWTSLTSGPSIQNSNSAVTTVSNLVGGSNIFVLTIVNGVCPTSTDTITINVGNLNVANAGVDKTTCADTSSLSAIIVTGTGTWSSLGVTLLGNNANASTTVSNLQDGNNIFVWTVSNGNCPISYDTITITKTQPPSIANAGNDISTCDSVAILNATSPTSGFGIWTKVGANTSQVVTPSLSISKVENLQVGTFTYKWTVTKPGCNISSSDLVQVNIYEPDTNMKAMPDTTITPGTSVTLYATGASIYSWEPGNNLSCINCSKPIFDGISNITYTITMTDVHGCSLVDSLKITTALTKFVEVADIFSPNAPDEVNRTFKIHHSGLKDLEVNLFNEFGEAVFTINSGDSFDKNWDGTRNGVPMTSASFVYIIVARYLDNTSEIKSGKIRLQR